MMQNKLKNLRVILLTVFVVILMAILMFCGRNSIKTKYLNYEDVSFLNLQKGVSIEQKFNSTENYLQSISLFFVNVFPEMDKLYLEISDFKGGVIFKDSVDASQLLPGEFNKFDIKKHVEKDEDYILSLKYTGKGGADYLGIMAAPSEKNLPFNGECIYGGNAIDLNIVTLYETRTISLMGVMVLITAMLIIVVFVVPTRRKESE